MKRLLALVALLAPTVACDQATKALAVDHLRGEAAVNLAGGAFRLVYAENPGAFLSLGRSLPDAVRQPALIGVVALLLTALSAYLLWRRPPTPVFVAGALLLAGGLGNLIDRIARDGGRVVDFAQLRLPGGPVFLSTGVFNVADLYIVGAGLAVAYWSWRRPGLLTDREPAPTHA